MNCIFGKKHPTGQEVCKNKEVIDEHEAICGGVSTGFVSIELPHAYAKHCFRAELENGKYFKKKNESIADMMNKSFRKIDEKESEVAQDMNKAFGKIDKIQDTKKENDKKYDHLIVE